MADRTSLATSAALAVFVGVGAVLSRQDPLVVALASAVGVAVAIVLHRTRRHLLLVSTVGAVAVAVLCSPLPSNSGWFAICVLAGICSLRGGDRTGVAFTVIGLAVFAQQWVVASEETGWVTWIAGIVFTTVVCLMARRQLELTERLRAAQAGLADRARAEERNRIARELHDVIGHSLTVSLLHVSSARLALREDPHEALAALEEAERLGRQSLDEVRHAVGLLRDDGASSSTPLPGTAELPTLVDGFRRAGIQVSYDVQGDPAALLDTAGLTLYRILQEALTNVARHAPDAEVSVRLSVGARETVLTVHSAGRPGIPNEDGVGLHSMRERAAALGGQLAVGPVDTGWQVRATLPVAPREAVTPEAGVGR